MEIEDAYRELLFHGPLFQGIVAIEGMDERGARARLRALAARRECVAGAEGLRVAARSRLLDSALQVQVLWARLQWDVTLLPAADRRLARARRRRRAASRFATSCGSGPRAAPPLCHADHWFYGSDGRLLATLEDVVGRRHAGAEPARGSARVSDRRSARRRDRRAWPACSRARRDLDAYWRNILGRRRRDLRPAAGGLGSGRLLRPRVRRRRPHLLPARRLPRRARHASTRSPTASRRWPWAASPTSGWRCRSPATRSPTPAQGELPERGPRAHRGRARQGHLPERRQRDRGAAGAGDRPDARADPQPVSRQHRGASSSGCARSCSACCRRSAPRPSPG